MGRWWWGGVATGASRRDATVCDAIRTGCDRDGWRVMVGGMHFGLLWVGGCTEERMWMREVRLMGVADGVCVADWALSLGRSVEEDGE